MAATQPKPIPTPFPDPERPPLPDPQPDPGPDEIPLPDTVGAGVIGAALPASWRDVLAVVPAQGTGGCRP